MSKTSRPLEEQLRNMAIWQAQAIGTLKRALRQPGTLTTAVIDPGGTYEYLLEVIAHERVKLILPIEEDEDPAE